MKVHLVNRNHPLSKPPLTSPSHGESRLSVPTLPLSPLPGLRDPLGHNALLQCPHIYLGFPPSPKSSSKEGQRTSTSQWQAPRMQENQHKETRKEEHPTDISYPAIQLLPWVFSQELDNSSWDRDKTGLNLNVYFPHLDTLIKRPSYNTDKDSAT